MQDSHEYWIEYAVEQLNTVQQVSARFDGLSVHSWPDDELIRVTSDQLSSKLKAMKQAVSPESVAGGRSERTQERSKVSAERE